MAMAEMYEMIYTVAVVLLCSHVCVRMCVYVCVCMDVLCKCISHVHTYVVVYNHWTGLDWTGLMTPSRIESSALY